MNTRQWISTLLSVVFLSPIFATASAESPDDIQWQAIDQVCGQVELSQPTRKMITVNRATEERLNVAYVVGATVSLYKADDPKKPCCENAQRVSQTTTGRYGGFQFANYSPGHYWLVVRKNKLDKSIPLHVTKQYDKKVCEAPEVGRSIIVDAVPYPKVQVRIR